MSLITSASRLVRSCTRSATKKDGIIMSRARQQMTISFMPIDRDRLRRGKLDNDTEKSFMLSSPYCKVLCDAKYYCKKFSGPRGRQSTHKSQVGLIFAGLRCVLNHLFQRREIFHETFAAARRHA